MKSEYLLELRWDEIKITDFSPTFLVSCEDYPFDDTEIKLIITRVNALRREIKLSTQR